MTIYTSGSGYTAKCTALSGNCSEISATILSSKYSLDKRVKFTQANKTISFNLTKVPTTNTVEFTSNLGWSNGTSASVAGTLKGNS